MAFSESIFYYKEIEMGDGKINSQKIIENNKEKASYRLLEESILPVWLNQRPISALGFVYLWIGIAVIIATFQLGANGVSGLPLTQVMIIIFLANVALACIMTLTADIGTEHGLSFAVYLRATFGIYGTHFPSVFRGIIAAIWFGIQTYLGALALNGIVEYLTGFSNWPLWYIVFSIIQVVNTALGIKAVERLASIAAPSIIIISIWMYFKLDNLATLKGLNIWTYAGDQNITVVTLFLANMAFWSTLGIDIPNITRFVKTVPSKNFISRNRYLFPAQLLALPITQTWVAIIGAASFIAAGDWNPINVIQQTGTGFVLILMLILVVLAQWSTNTAANLIPATLTFVNAGAPYVRYKWGVVISAIVGTMSVPWWILNHLFGFLFTYGSFLSAIGGIMIADYYVLRKRRLNVPDLYRKKGQFRYMGGVNPAGMIAWLVAGGLAFFSGTWAFVVGLIGGFFIYLILMKLWILHQYPQKEIISNYDNSFLGTSEGMNWVFVKGSGFFREKTEEISDQALKREDM
jgi:NCS1 family nucleobase:cation symporter-1